MRIELVKVPTQDGSNQFEPEVFSLNISGKLDPNHAVIKRAHELAYKSGNKDMIEAFHRSLQRGLRFALQSK